MKAGSHYEDSLNAKLKEEVNLGLHVEILNDLGAYFESTSNYKKSLFYLYKAKEIIDSIGLGQRLKTYNYLGYVYWHLSLYDSSFYYHNKALELLDDKDINQENIPFTYLMIGNDFYDTGEFDKSSEYYFKSLKKAEEFKNIDLQVKSHNRLSKLFFKLNDLELSHQHAQKAISLNFENDHRDLGDSYNTYGNIYLTNEQTDSALYYFKKTSYNFTKSGDVIGQAIAAINLGDTYLKIYEISKGNQNLDSSFSHYKASYNLNSKVENRFGVIYGLWGMADVHIERNEYDDALINYRAALRISHYIGAQSEISRLYLKLHTLFDYTSVTDSSLCYLKKHLKLKNIIENSEKSKHLILQESKYEAEKIIAEEKARIEKEQLIEQEKTKWKNMIFSLSIIAIIVLAYIVRISKRRLKIIKSKNQTIEKINNTLEIQKKEIIDSITYAKRIQNAMLPTVELMNSYLGNYFVLYQPKDIVAGDFYWIEKVEDTLLFAVADCTGHGVPGAMMSVVCKNALSNVVKEKKHKNPALILDDANRVIKNVLHSESQNMNDGMDISLCSWNLTTNELAYSGAFSSLYYMRDGVLRPLKGDRQPVGKFHKKTKPFTLHELSLKEGDTLYLFTDGYVDQFGGERDKKFGFKRFKSLLVQIHSMNMSEQKTVLSEKIHSWKEESNSEQLDDICVLGIKI